MRRTMGLGIGVVLLALVAESAWAEEPQRTAGEDQIHLPYSVRLAMWVRGFTWTDATVRVCLSAEGTPTRVELLESSGYAEADRNLVRAVKAWRYVPVTVEGVAVPRCTLVTFEYVFEDPLPRRPGEGRLARRSPHP